MPYCIDFYSTFMHLIRVKESIFEGFIKIWQKLKVKRPQLGFNGALELGIMNIIPFYLINNIQTIRPFVLDFHKSLVPRNGINMLWE